MKKRNLTKQKGIGGITLIALVITIIVLLILAGVSIAMLTGDNGILTQAQNAKKETENAQEKEQILLAIIAAMSNNKSGEVTKEELDEQFKLNGLEGKVDTTDNGDETITVTYGDNEYTVENGNVTGPVKVKKDTTPGVLDGSGTEEDPFVIMSIEDLVAFSQKVNTYKDQTNYEYVVLGKTLDFNSKSSYVDYNTTKYDEFLGGDGTTGLMEQLSSEGKGFIPIGSGFNASFYGTFDGQGYEIRNLYVLVGEGDCAGLFGDLMYEVTIKNLGVTGNITTEGDVAGGIVGYTYDTTKIYNCYNKCNVTATLTADYQGVGGIIGAPVGNTEVINCYNEGTINFIEFTGDAKNSVGAGGIVGSFRATAHLKIYNCFNKGEIKSWDRAGGILGANWYDGTGEVTNCYNVGKLTSRENDLFNISSETNTGVIITNCYYLEQNINAWDKNLATPFEKTEVSNIVENLNNYIKDNESTTTGWNKWKLGADNWPMHDYKNN